MELQKNHNDYFEEIKCPNQETYLKNDKQNEIQNIMLRQQDFFCKRLRKMDAHIHGNVKENKYKSTIYWNCLFDKKQE